MAKFKASPWHPGAMLVPLVQLLDLAVKDPGRVTGELMKLSDADRRRLLDYAASGEISRRLAAAHVGALEMPVDLRSKLTG